MESTVCIVSWADHKENVNEYLSKHYSEERFTDVSIACDGNLIKAHRIVLSGSSTYFEEILRLHNHPNLCITLDSVPFPSLRSILEFMYTGKMKVVRENLDKIIEVACRLGIRGIDVNMKKAYDTWSGSNDEKTQQNNTVLKESQNRQKDHRKDDSNETLESLSNFKGKIKSPKRVSPQKILSVNDENHITTESPVRDLSLVKATKSTPKKKDSASPKKVKPKQTSKKQITKINGSVKIVKKRKPKNIVKFSWKKSAQTTAKNAKSPKDVAGKQKRKKDDTKTIKKKSKTSPSSSKSPNTPPLVEGKKIQNEDPLEKNKEDLTAYLELIKTEAPKKKMKRHPLESKILSEKPTPTKRKRAPESKKDSTVTDVSLKTEETQNSTKVAEFDDIQPKSKKSSTVLSPNKKENIQVKEEPNQNGTTEKPLKKKKKSANKILLPL